LNQEDCVICGIVISELYSGIKSNKEEKAVELFVNSLDCLSVEESDWQKIGQLISHFKKNGLSVPFQDAVLAFLSIKYGCKILTLDKHFPMMKVLDDRIMLWEVC
jgi:predicted nucleic acid-binding protein